jgi:hypothetical protein
MLDIKWYPMISPLKENVNLNQVQGLQHEILGLEENGDILICDLHYQNSLRSHPLNKTLSPVSQIYLGR